MAKISFDYMNAANRMAEKGDYESALHYYFLQRNKKHDKHVDVAIGDTYAAMGLNREAIRYYMRAYAADRHNERALNGLIYCYKDIDEEAAYYYLHFALAQSDEIDDFGLIVDDLDYPPLTVHDKKDKSEVMDMAINMLENGDAEGAKEAFLTIDKDAYQYCDSLLARASMEMDKANAAEALLLADEALSVNPNHLGTHVLKIMAYDALGDKENAEKWINKLDLLNPRDEDDVTKVALCFCNFNRYELAEKYLLRKLEYTPYDKFMLLCLSAVYVAKGDEHMAFKTANRVCSIYPDDIEAKEIASRIFSRRIVQMPDEMFILKREWSMAIKKLFLEDSAAITQPENVKLIKWLLQNDDDLYLQSAVCSFITSMPEFDSLMDEVLIDPFAPAIVKKQILLRRVCDDKTKRVKFVIANLFRSLKVKHPSPDNLKYAYYYVFIALAVTEIHFEKKLNASLKKVSAKFEQCSDPKKTELPIGALAALLYFATMGGTIKKSCTLFDCEEDDFKKAANMLDFLRR